MVVGKRRREEEDDDKGGGAPCFAEMMTGPRSPSPELGRSISKSMSLPDISPSSLPVGRRPACRPSAPPRPGASSSRGVAPRVDVSAARRVTSTDFQRVASLSSSFDREEEETSDDPSISVGYWRSFGAVLDRPISASGWGRYPPGSRW